MVSTLKAFPSWLLHPTWAVGEAELLESILECVGAARAAHVFMAKQWGMGLPNVIALSRLLAWHWFPCVWSLSTPTFPIPLIPAPVLATDAGIADECLLAQ